MGLAACLKQVADEAILLTHSHKQDSLWARKKLERQQLWREGVMDHEKRELIAVRHYPTLRVLPAEVIYEGRRYLHPNLRRI